MTTKKLSYTEQKAQTINYLHESELKHINELKTPAEKTKYLNDWIIYYFGYIGI